MIPLIVSVLVDLRRSKDSLIVAANQDQNGMSMYPFRPSLPIWLGHRIDPNIQ